MGSLHIYRNKRTGVSFETPCVCAGEDWEEITPEAPASEKAKPAKAPAKSGTKRKK